MYFIRQVYFCCTMQYMYLLTEMAGGDLKWAETSINRLLPYTESSFDSSYSVHSEVDAFKMLESCLLNSNVTSKSCTVRILLYLARHPTLLLLDILFFCGPNLAGYCSQIDITPPYVL